MTTAQTVIPSIIVDRSAAALEFYVRALGAREVYRLAYPDGSIAHAELEIEGQAIYLAEEHPKLEFFGPHKLGGTSSSITLYVDEVDRVVAQAVAAGATLERPITDEFYGDRVGSLRDPFGHRWSVHTRRERLTTEEITGRFTDLMRCDGS